MAEIQTGFSFCISPARKQDIISSIITQLGPSSLRMEKSKDYMIEELLQNFHVTSKDVISHDGPVFPNVFPDIDRKTAKWIDQQLDWEDAVSFSFLVVDKVDIALKLSR